MPANEAVELHRALALHKLPQGPLFLNGVFARRFTPQERVAVARGGPALASAGEAAEAHEARADLSERYEKLLREQVSSPLVPIPHFFEQHFGLAALEKVAAAIGDAL
jgi:hypothetical protein